MRTFVGDPMPATALVVDLRGFTSELSATADDPRGRTKLLELLATVHGEAVACAGIALRPDQRGDLAQRVHFNSTGDGAIVVFVDPEHHACHGWLTALLLRARLTRDCRRYLVSMGREVAFGIGVESGHVRRAGTLDGPSLTTFLGACINAAARVESLTRDIHRTDTIVCGGTVTALAQSLLKVDYHEFMRATDVPAGTLSDAEFLALETRMVGVNRQLCINFLHRHQLRGFSSPTSLFRLSKSSVMPGNPRFETLLNHLTGGDRGWGDEVREALRG